MWKHHFGAADELQNRGAVMLYDNIITGWSTQWQKQLISYDNKYSTYATIHLVRSINNSKLNQTHNQKHWSRPRFHSPAYLFFSQDLAPVANLVSVNSNCSPSSRKKNYHAEAKKFKYDCSVNWATAAVDYFTGARTPTTANIQFIVTGQQWD